MSTYIPVTLTKKTINGVTTRKDSGSTRSNIPIAIARKVVNNQVVRKS